MPVRRKASNRAQRIVCKSASGWTVPTANRGNPHIPPARSHDLGFRVHHGAQRTSSRKLTSSKLWKRVPELARSLPSPAEAEFALHSSERGPRSQARASGADCGDPIRAARVLPAPRNRPVRIIHAASSGVPCQSYDARRRRQAATEAFKMRRPVKWTASSPSLVLPDRQRIPAGSSDVGIRPTRQKPRDEALPRHARLGKPVS
jgi:hypothetical protein